MLSYIPCWNIEIVTHEEPTSLLWRKQRDRTPNDALLVSFDKQRLWTFRIHSLRYKMLRKSLETSAVSLLSLIDTTLIASQLTQRLV